MTQPVSRVGPLLFFSGACALVYQVAWFRELRLVFGASTAASAAVLAVFMGGLGIGGARLGRRADKAKNPLAFYANLELLVALAAAVSPILSMIARAIYIGVGGSASLGGAGATIARLVMGALVLLPATFLMGGTLPAASRAVGTHEDASRRNAAALYGINTLGAVAGAVAANFLLLEALGSRLTLLTACAVNLAVGLTAHVVARIPPPAATPKKKGAEPEENVAEEKTGETPADAPAVTIPAWLPPGAAAVAGFAFMSMELVWYRMLAPILGGSSYTFGLILAVALAGIGIGGVVYARGSIPATPRAFAMTCALEALFVAIPYALGDRIALLALVLRPMSALGFTDTVMAWTLVCSIVVLPAAIVSGAQFPLIIGLYGRGARALGRDVGHAYLANTLGAIAGALAGGFGLMPVLSAPGFWRACVVLLVAASAAALFAGRGRSPWTVRTGVVAACSALPLLLLGATGPTPLWRHFGIGVGRLDALIPQMTASTMEKTRRSTAGGVYWEEDGIESGIAVMHSDGYVFVVNGKTDGHSLSDAGTQVMSGLLAALLHPSAKRIGVVGLGTGSTAGWLAAVPEVERVDVIELEPAIVRVARDCAPVNHDALDSPKLHVSLGDAREALLTTKQRYDMVVSEPSNPYRAGTSSFYTRDFYAAVAHRLEPGGMFVQWMQGYEVDLATIASVYRTMHEVFAEVSTWITVGNDLVLIARAEAAPVDMDLLRRRVNEEPFKSALRDVWGVSSAEGVVARHAASDRMTQILAGMGLGAVETDDANSLEFAFARTVGTKRNTFEAFLEIARDNKLARPETKGDVEWARVDEERSIVDSFFSEPPVRAAGPALLRDIAQTSVTGDYGRAARDVKQLNRAPRSPREATLFAHALVHVNDPDAAAAIELVQDEGERLMLGAELAAAKRDLPGAAAALEKAFATLRTDPWPSRLLASHALELAHNVGELDAGTARRLFAALDQPFAVQAHRNERITVRTLLAASAHDDAGCVAALQALEPHVLWDRQLLATRAACYAATNDPRSSAAQADFKRFVDLSGELEKPTGAAGEPQSRSRDEPAK